MGKIIDFNSYRNEKNERRSAWHKSQRELARMHISEAAKILSTLGADDGRVAWLLEDSVDLLGNCPVLSINQL